MFVAMACLVYDREERIEEGVTHGPISTSLVWKRHSWTFMDNIKEKILRFDTLSAEDQQAVEAYVDAHPEWRALFDEVRALSDMAREARILRHVDDETLAYYVVAEHTELGASPALRRIFDELEACLDDDPELRTRYDALASRLEELAASFDPTAQFEALTGFEVASLKGLSSDDASDAPAGRPAEQAAPSSSEHEALVVSLPRAVRWAVAAVVVIGVLYGGLFAASRVMQSDVERLASVEPGETRVEGYSLTLRGAPAAADTTSTDALYLQALRTLRDARTTTLGLFPRYDQQKLGQAEQLLQRVIKREESRSFLQVEAHFFLGKVHLGQGKIEAARSNFQTVATSEGRRAAEAVEILTQLQKQYPAHRQSHLG